MEDDVKQSGADRYAVSQAYRWKAERDTAMQELRQLKDSSRDTTVSAYDLLPQEDRDAIAWVRKHGGLDSVKKLLDWVVGHCSTRQQLDFDFWLSGRVMHELGFDEDMADRDEVGRRLLARLMPEGYEWPMVDGKPVVIGERMRSCGIDDCKVVGIDPGNSRLILASDNIEEGKATYFTDFAEYCHRPAPKVLDADGVEIRVGDTVYLLPGDWCDKFPLFSCHEWDAMKAIDLSPNHDEGRIECEKSDDGVRCYPYPQQLTHRAPVLAADGRPLREGETVWKVKNGDGPYHVQEIRDGVSVCVEETSCEFMPEELTHERPDSWEKWREDSELRPIDYCVMIGYPPSEEESTELIKNRDLVRRAKALAERSE